MNGLNLPCLAVPDASRRSRGAWGWRASSLALVAALAAGPAQAQLSTLRSAGGLGAAAAAPIAPHPSVGSVITPGMSALVARAVANQTKASNTGAMLSEANAAARAAALALAQTVHNGLGAGGLDPVANGVAAADDPTGLHVWQGASAPVQTTSGSAVTVTITQTATRALLSWNSFDIGRDTTLTFSQKSGGVAQPGWVAVNRVVGTSTAPSQILGAIKADGTVLVLNQNGVLFGATAQVNLHSLVVSSLELGAPTKLVNSAAVDTTLAEREAAFLQNGITSATPSVLVSAMAGERTDGTISVATGASLTADAGGFIILTGPTVSTAGALTVGIGGQISLQAGLETDVYTSTGAADSLDPYVRGLLLASSGAGTVDAGGLLTAPQGYISIGASQQGSATLSGIASLTTSVSRNGKFSLTAGTATLAPDAVIEIDPDTSSATIPQSPDSVAAFKTSQIEIGSRFYDPLIYGDLRPADITLGTDSLILAPSATVNVGGTAGGAIAVDGLDQVANSQVDIQSGATIDVSGVKDYQIAASANSLAITPAKRNELRDTPNYREVSIDGNFTLNGATLYVDPRVSGVRADGVAWVGSPLLEAGSLAAQIPVTAQQLMTRGGNVTLSVVSVTTPIAEGGYVPKVTIAQGATIDTSGGWVHYLEGTVRTSRLLTADGRIVDIADADPNDTFVAVSSGFDQNLPQLSSPLSYSNTLLDSYTYNAAYIEGRDAGSLTVRAPVATLNGTYHADAFAGSRQIADARPGSATSSIAGDNRNIQADPQQLPTGGLLRIQSLRSQIGAGGTIITEGGNIVVSHAATTPDPDQTTLTDSFINASGISGLSLQTSGSVSFTADSAIALQPGGFLNVDAGRTITFDGSISAPSGAITARTYALTDGSPFTTDDDLPSLIAAGAAAPSLFDIVVNGTLSTRGRWVNDYLVSDGYYGGSAYTDGGSISLTVAPHVAAAVDTASPTAVDLSGSILINQGALLDVSSGGYVSNAGKATLTAKGGNVSLTDETVYFQTASAPGFGSNDPFLTSLSSFQLAPEDGRQSALVPDAINSKVAIAEGSIVGFGFGGGGTFSLTAPDLDFGSHGDGTGTSIPLDFIQKTGFGALDLTTYKTDIIANPFANGQTGKTALLEMQQVVVGAGETLDLTQAVLPSFLTVDQYQTLQSLASGGDVRSVLTPGVPVNAYDQQAVSLTLGGLTELDVLNGGTVTGAARSSITASKIYNDGTIRIAGGDITQQLVLPGSYGGQRAAIGVQGGVAGLATVFGSANADGLYSESAQNALGIVDGSGNVLTNADLVSRPGGDRQIYLLGLVPVDKGVLLTSRSVTDLSGVSLRDPRAPFLADGSQMIRGTLIDGGTITALGALNDGSNLFSTPAFGRTDYLIDPIGGGQPSSAQVAQQLVAEAGAHIGLAGARDNYDVQSSVSGFSLTPEWSSGGTLSALGGGTITGAVIDAHGGASSAQGGTIEWANPILTQSASVAPALNVLSADQIAGAGFDNMIAHGNLSTLGDVSVTLRDSFILSAPTVSASNDPLDYQITVDSKDALSITAAYIGFDSIVQSVAYPVAQDAVDATGTATFNAQAIDVAGAVSFGPSLNKVTLNSQGDIRLIGVRPLSQTLSPTAPVTNLSLSGQIIFGGDALFRAAQVYATTGTGNLQKIADGAATATPYLIASLGQDATIRFERSSNSTPATPYSAGSYLAVQAPHIEQDGVIRAPLGRIDLGVSTPVTVTTQNADGSTTIASPQSVKIEDGSITSVSAAGLSIPYGTTTDLTEYFFTPTDSGALKAPPAAELRIAGGSIDVAQGATVDASGGGDLFAYEFVSGVGGSRDVLSQFNSDAFSSNNGFQYADGRQVYAIMPSNKSTVAMFDPIYSADYANLYGSDVGKSVYLDAAPGLAAGYYTLLPAHYALLPGALRVVENSGAGAPLPGTSLTQLDGSIVVGGNYGVAGTNIADSQRFSFTVESQATFLKYSNIQVTGGTKTFTDIANDAGTVAPQLPADAARIVLAAQNTLDVEQKFLTTAATGGRGAKVDILGNIIEVIAPDGTPTDGALSLTTSTINNIAASSLLLGGLRTDNADGSTDLAITASAITIATNAANPLQASEIVLAVDGADSALTIADGASIVATGTLADTRAGDYNVAVGADTGAGAVFRLASGTERLVNRTGTAAEASASDPATLSVGAASLTGATVTLDTSSDLTIDQAAAFATPLIALGGNTINFGPSVPGRGGVEVTPELAATLGAAQRLTLRSPNVIGFAAGDYQFNDLTIDAQGVRLLRQPPAHPGDALDVTIHAGAVSLANSAADRGGCKVVGAYACGHSGNTLEIDGTSLTFGTGTFRTYGFDSSVSLAASGGMTYQGNGAINVGGADLNLVTPYIVDAALVADPRQQKLQPSLTLATTGAVSISAPSGATVAPTAIAAPGAKLAIGSIDAPVASVAIDGALLRATAGTLDVRSRGDIAVTGAAVLSTPGYSRAFGSDPDKVTVSAAGGALNLVSLNGGISVAQPATLSVGGGAGKAGSLLVAAADGIVALDGTIEATAPDGGASFTLDSGLSAFDFASFVRTLGTHFTGDVSIRTGAGDLALDAGEKLTASSVSLTADGGGVDIGGTIDTSGVNGGDIGLYGADSVTLEGTALLDAHANGYGKTDTRQASGGDVTLGTKGSGVLTVDDGALIDVGARVAGNRLIAKTQKDPSTLADVTSYSFVEADQGGTLTLRAPVIQTGNHESVNVAFAGTVNGARDISVEGYRSYDLATVAQGGADTGVTINDAGQAVLDLGVGGNRNVLGGTVNGGLVNFIQHFDISGSDANFGSLVSDANFHERPGVELDYSGDIVLGSNWNLGAGTVNVAGAVAAGLMEVSPLGRYADGSQRYEVIPGKEAEVFQRFTTLLYRTGGRVDGEAATVTLRAGGNLDIEHSITDGFFTFGDETDPDYISYQLGGGDRTYHPAVQITCGTLSSPADCSSLTTFEPGLGNMQPAPDPTEAINISLAQIGRGQENLLDAAAPYSAVANSAAALGVQDGGAGDPIGSAQIFPVLADGSAAQSSSIQLVGGAGAAISANPLHIDRATAGNVVVSGESSYTLAAAPRTGAYAGALSYAFNDGAGTLSYTGGELLASLIDLLGVDSDTLGSSQTRITLPNSSGAKDFLLRSAKAYFAGNPDSVEFYGPAQSPNGFTASLSDVVGFLESTNASGQTFASRYARGIESGSFGNNPPMPLPAKLATVKTVRVNTLVRTGTGAIDIAAAGDVDLRNAGSPQFLGPNGGRVPSTSAAAAQAGGSAVYTVGHAVTPGLVSATVTTTGQTLTVDPGLYALTADMHTFDYVPRADGELQTNPIYADGGGSIAIAAGRDVLGRLDVWSEVYGGQDRDSPYGVLSPDFGIVGSSDQRWRVGLMGFTGTSDASNTATIATNIRINPQQFSSGVGALGGGDVSIIAGRDVSDLTVALDTSVTTANVGASVVQMTFGGGSLAIRAGQDLLGGRIDVASGEAVVKVAGSIGSAGVINQLNTAGVVKPLENLPQIRLSDATIDLEAGGTVELAGVAALGVRQGLSRLNAAGFYSPVSSLAILANGAVAIDNANQGVTTAFSLDPEFGQPVLGRSGVVMPAALSVTSMTGDIDLDKSGQFPILLYPSPLGQLSLFAGGTLAPVTIDVDDGDPSLLPGIFSAFRLQDDGTLASGRPFGLPLTYSNTSELVRRLFHNANPTHTGDTQPIRIATDGSLVDTTLFASKQARISAGVDIVNMIFNGQNLAASDITRITAGRDITADTTLATVSGSLRSLIAGNQFILGGPGTLFVEAGRNLGPFLNSAVAGGVTYAGGILTVGNDYNPVLPSQGASIYTLFGVAKGTNFDGLRDYYLDPANLANLDGDLFEQVTDINGNKTPDRTKPIYAPILIAWLQANEPAALSQAFGTTDVTFEQAYTAFAALPELRQREFLLDKVYFNELAAPSRPDGPSYLQYVRGYRAVDTLFPASLGYTANDLSGQQNGGSRIETGNLDLRLAAIETEHGGDITILAPGGNAILGSVVATSTQAARRAYPRAGGPLLSGGRGNETGQAIDQIPIGFEGVLTLGGGTIHGFADGDFRLNQSRLFTLDGGDIVLWSSNGDLNAGQGPKTAANFPPITERFDLDGFGEVDSAGSVSGAGIAAFQPSLDIPAPSVTLIAPAGTVDAGDAGVRAAGDIFVAAAQVANADNFKVGGQSVGIPSLGNVTAPVVPASATAAVVANLARANDNSGLGDQRSRITVDILGYYQDSDDRCKTRDGSQPKDCPPQSQN